MDALGNAQQRAIQAEDVQSAFAWAPDENRIAYVSGAAKQREVYIVDLDQKKELRLTKNKLDEELGGWSPDGKWVVYAVTSPPDRQGIYKKNPDGVNEIQLTAKPDFAPRWSPDGNNIAFLSERDGDLEIYVMDEDGEEAVYVMGEDGEEAINVTKKPGDDYDFEWSRDSNRLVFVSERDGNPEIYVVESDGDNPQRLTSNRAVDAAPRWSQDGDRIIFASNADGDFDLFIMDRDGKNQTRLTATESDEMAPDW